MDITQKPQRIISCCTGLGGIERGLKRAGVTVQPVVYLEIEAFICANLVCAMEAGKLATAPIWTDIKTFNAKPFHGLVDGIIGGYPCPPFSCAGTRKGADDPRHLYPYISGIIKAAGPVWCFFENVEGHLSLGYPEVSADLRSMGYAVEAGIYSAEEVGAPHRRDRLFILAIKQEYVAHMQKSGIGRLSECKQGQERSRSGNSVDVDRKCENVDNTGSNRFKQEYKVSTGWNSAELTSEELENTNQPGLRGRDNGIQGREGCAGEASGSGKLAYAEMSKREQSGNTRRGIIGFTDNGRSDTKPKQLADSSRERCERGERGERGEFNGASAKGFREQKSHGSTTECGSGLWPARPGEQQYEWEEPRTITNEEQAQSGMGGAIDGYNFREDLLRAYGNSVVEQTAEIAFIDLLNKHIANQIKPL